MQRTAAICLLIGTLLLPGLVAGGQADFRGKDAVLGEYRVALDTGWEPGWVELAPMPALPSGRQVRDGGLLVAAGDRLYAFKGNKTAEFFTYDIDSNSWAQLPSVPPGPYGKMPGKGAAALIDGRYIYLVKGNGTNEFWRFDTDPDSLSWEQLPAIPPGVSGVRVKAGTGIVALKAGTGQTPTYFYLLKGNRTDFMRYDPEARVWTSLPDLPAGVQPRWNRGSWLVAHRRHQEEIYHLYAHKSRLHELWRFDVLAGSWRQNALPGIPFVGMTGRSRKARDGSSAAFEDRALWALKGGSTTEFWRFSLDSLNWRERESIPSVGSTGKTKRVKGGGSIVATRDAFFALKGNKTLELWRYVVPPVPAGRPGRAGAAAGPAGSGLVSFGPNPAGALRFSLAVPGRVRVTLHDNSGRVALRLLDSELAAGEHRLALSGAGLARGVYLAQLTLATPAGVTSAQQKVILTGERR